MIFTLIEFQTKLFTHCMWLWDLLFDYIFTMNVLQYWKNTCTELIQSEGLTIIFIILHNVITSNEIEKLMPKMS